MRCLANTSCVAVAVTQRSAIGFEYTSRYRYIFAMCYNSIYRYLNNEGKPRESREVASEYSVCECEWCNSELELEHECKRELSDIPYHAGCQK